MFNVFKNSLLFTFFDLILFFSLFFLHAYLFRSFAVDGSANIAGLGVVSRLIYGQVILQIIFLILLLKYNYFENLFLVILSVIMSYVISGVVWTFNFSNIPKYFLPRENAGYFNELYVLLISVSIVWFLYSKFIKN